MKQNRIGGAIPPGSARKLSLALVVASICPSLHAAEESTFKFDGYLREELSWNTKNWADTPNYNDAGKLSMARTTLRLNGEWKPTDDLALVAKLRGSREVKTGFLSHLEQMGANNSTAGVTAAVASADFTAGNLTVDTAVASGEATLQTGANEGDETTVAFVNTALSGGTGAAAMDTLAATLKTFSTDGTRENASSLITALDGALGSISSSRATLGAAQNRLQHTIANLGTTSENLSASNSRIRDVDVATESSNMAKNQVLEQAGVSVLAQANQLPQLALKLLG